MSKPDFGEIPEAAAVAGKDWLLEIWVGTEMVALSGQQGLTINRSAEPIEVTSKDTKGGWKSRIPGMKEYSIDNNGLFVLNDPSHKELTNAFNTGEPVCWKIYDVNRDADLFGGLASIVDYPIDAAYDAAVTYTISLQGMGAIVDLTESA